MNGECEASEFPVGKLFPRDAEVGGDSARDAAGVPRKGDEGF